MVATRAAVDRCGPGHVLSPLSPTGTEDGQGQGGGERDEEHGGGPEDPPPEEPGTQYYGLDDDDSVPELSGGRPGPVLDPGLSVAGMGRHTGEAFELVLDPVVPQLGRDIMEVPGQGAQGFVEHWEQLATIAGLDPGNMFGEIFGRRRREHEAAEAAEPSEASESRSSNKMGKKGKRRKRRKKKLPKTSSSTSSRCRERNQQGAVLGQDLHARRVQRQVPGVILGQGLHARRVQRQVPGVLGQGLHARRVQRQVPGVILGQGLHARRVQRQVPGFFLDKVYMPVVCNDGSYSWTRFTCPSCATTGAGSSWTRFTCPSCATTGAGETSQVQIRVMAKTVKDVTWLLFDDSLDLGLQLGRINTVFGCIHRMIKTGQLSIDDDDEKLGNDDDPKFKTMGPGGEKLHDGSHAEFVEFSGSLGTARSILRSSAGPAEAGWQSSEVSEFMDLVPRG